MTDEEAVVERAARLVLRYRDSEEGEYRGTTADEVLREVAEDLDEWVRLARRALRRVREIRGEERVEGVPPRARKESALEPVSSPGPGRTRPRDTY